MKNKVQWEGGGGEGKDTDLAEGARHRLLILGDRSPTSDGVSVGGPGLLDRKLSGGDALVGIHSNYVISVETNQMGQSVATAQSATQSAIGDCCDPSESK